MDLATALTRLTLFNIPSSASTPDALRTLLAALLASRSILLGELQTARDIIMRRAPAAFAPDVEPYAYLFIAALFLSQRQGNTYLRVATAPTLLRDALYSQSTPTDSTPLPFPPNTIDELWSAALHAATTLEGDVLFRVSTSSGDCWFFKRNLSAVQFVTEGLTRLEEASRISTDQPLTDAELSAVKQIDASHTLNAEQIAAVQTIISHRFAVVTGGPGTGKTTIVCAFLRVLISRGLEPSRIALIAPTGRAAQRMGEALRGIIAATPNIAPTLRDQINTLSGSTIHSLLGGRPPHWKYTSDNKLHYKLVVVDESSMVDIHLMKALLAALADDCRLVLLGDKDQLPPVEAGAILGDIVSHRTGACVVHLRISNRFHGSLAQEAAAINQGDVDTFEALAPDLATLPDGLKAFTRDETANTCFRSILPSSAHPSTCHTLLKEWARQYGLHEKGTLAQLASDPSLLQDAALTQGTLSPKMKKIFDTLNAARILTVVHEGPYGDKAINTLLVRLRFGGHAPTNPLARAGIPVLITANTPARNLWNGDIGVTVRGSNGMLVLFPRGEKVVACPVALLPPHELAYAITVHKSQGSEFENVLVVLPADEKNPLLSRSLVYTGVTRARRRALLLSTRNAYVKALTTSHTRDTTL